MFNFNIDVTIVKTRQRLRPSSVRPGPMVRVSGALRARRCDTASWCRALTGIYKLFISPTHQPQHHPHQPACRRPIFQIFSAENWNVNNSGVVTEEEGCGEGAVQSRLAGYLVHTQPAMAAPQPNTNRVEANSLDNFSFLLESFVSCVLLEIRILDT